MGFFSHEIKRTQNTAFLIMIEKGCFRKHAEKNIYICVIKMKIFFRKWPFSGEDDRGKTSPRALVFTRCDIQSELL